MTPENPYAAPQTNLHPTAKDSRPTAKSTASAERRLFPELDTASLRLLAARSGLIADMPWVWLTLLVVGALPFVFFMAFLDFPGSNVLTVVKILLAVAVLSVLRFVIGFFRWKSNRYFFFLMDGLLTSAAVLGCLACAYHFFRLLRLELTFGGFMLGVCSITLGIVSFIGWRVCQALANAPELFEAGKFPHKLLRQEVKYRTEHGIA